MKGLRSPSAIPIRVELPAATITAAARTLFAGEVEPELGLEEEELMGVIWNGSLHSLGLHNKGRLGTRGSECARNPMVPSQPPRPTPSDPEQNRTPENCPWPIVLGLDPGTKIMGYGAILDVRGDHRLLAAGTVRPVGEEAPARLADIARQATELFERLRPTVIVVETAFSTQNVQSALRLGEARGVLLAAASRFGAQVVQYAPAVPRKTLLGNGNAKKEQVAAMVATLLGLTEPPKPLDVTDALSLALAFLHRGKTLDALTRGSSRSRLQP